MYSRIVRSRKLAQFTFGVTLVVLLLAGCDVLPAQPIATPTPIPPPSTSTPIPPTATSVPPTATPRPPTSTPTPVPPTATPIPPTSTPTPVPPTPKPKPFAIQDKAFEADYKGQCDSDVDIVSVDGDSFNLNIRTLSMRGGRMTMWCYGAKHTWIGKLTYAGYTFNSDKDSPLQFMVDEYKGYVYLQGKGAVTLPDGTVVKLPR
jgi:hypothetical protein